MVAALLTLRPIGAAQTLPAPPQVFIDTTYVSAPSTRHVAAGGDLQAALDAAEPGETITLEPGATYTGPFVLPAKAGSAWIVVRTSAPDSGLPPPGRRMTPAYAALLPKLLTPDSGPAIRTAPGAHHYRLMGIEVGLAAGVTQCFGLVYLGDGSSAQNALANVPHHLILDRVYIHGRLDANVRRGVALNSATTAVIDSSITEIHEMGADSQAIGGWNGPGAFKITNNFLEGAGENILFGGADPSITNLVPSDIEIRGNHFSKPLSWRVGDASYGGREWSVKNLFELKNARRVLVRGNVFEYNWLHAQNGFAILLTVRNQDGLSPWSVIEDVTFTHNVIRHVSSGINILGQDDIHTSEQMKRVLISDNVFEDVDHGTWGGLGRLLQVLNGTADVTVDHNTAFQTTEILVAAQTAHERFTYRNNIAPHNLYGVGGDNTFGNPALTLSTYFPGAVFVRNVLVEGMAASYPEDNFFPPALSDVGFVERSAGDYRLRGDSPYATGATDGTDIGADVGTAAVMASNAAIGIATVGGAQGIPAGTPFLDEPLLAGYMVRAGHFTELRNRIGARRTHCGLDPFPWTDATLTPGSTPVRAVHVTELRAALNAAYAACRLPIPTYTDPAITPGETMIRAVHIAQLRTAIVALEWADIAAPGGT